ncbi:MAG TPA: hypothetical protein VG796_29880 [Verrucomicrobiales bacterium]|nr:hypothetical protein [Verrucomicrobiales bacterium]
MPARASRAVWETHPPSLIETTSSYSFTAAEIWRFASFGTITAEGDAADNADPDHDGLENLIECAFARNPLIPDAASLPQWQSVNGEYALTFTLPPGISCVAEFNITLEAVAWEPLSNLSVPPQYTFQLTPSAESRLYLRLRVNAP